MGGTHKQNALRVQRMVAEGKMGKKVLKYDRLTERQELVALDVALGKRVCDIARIRMVSANSINLWKKYHEKLSPFTKSWIVGFPKEGLDRE